MSLDATVVVCTKDRAEMLREALLSLIALATDHSFVFEILVVDNGSTDPTPRVVDEVAVLSSVPVRQVVEPRPGVVPARNRGVAEARGEWIAFFDDDQLADPRWLTELLAAAREKEARCVGGAVALKLPAGCRRQLAPLPRVLLSETLGMDQPQWYTRKTNPGTGNVLIHRSVFEELGGFSEAMHARGEDTELYRRMLAAGIQAWYTPAAIIHHIITPARLEDKYFLGIAGRMGAGLAVLEQRDWGRLYPFWWAARIGQCLLVVWPQRIWASLFADDEAHLAARCRLALSQSYIHSGLGLLFSTPPEIERPVVSRNTTEPSELAGKP
jgi:GT2 family glycosyltransferase